MKNIYYSILCSGLLLFSSCGGSDSLETKKKEYDEIEKELVKTKKELDALKEAIQAIDPTWKNTKVNGLLVETEVMESQAYTHKILTRGAVASRRNVEVGAESTGRILSIKAIEGRHFKKGQTLVQIDSEVVNNQIAELTTNYELANDIYMKRKRLRERNVGTEVEFLEAKNKKEGLERQLKTLRTNLSYATVRAPFDGTVDEVFVREGQVTSAGSPLLRFISLKDMYIQSDVSEKYLGDFIVGDSVDIKLPTLGTEFSAKINAIGKVIDKVSRTFTVESRIAQGQKNVQPNLIAIMEIVDYYNPSAIVVPTNVVLEDNKGDYVYVVAKDDQKRLVAQKRYITIGNSYDGKLYVSEGLNVNDQVIINGHRQATPNTVISIAK